MDGERRSLRGVTVALSRWDYELYEVRERPSKTYSWKAFMVANIVVELPWNTLAAVGLFFCFYYPIGLYRNAEYTDAVTERGGLFFLFVRSPLALGYT